MHITFDSQFQDHGKINTIDIPSSDDMIRREPMVFSADPNFACKQGGFFTNCFLRKLEMIWDLTDKIIIDSRTLMMMPDWYPCIPGWHVDDVPRTRADGQPDHRFPCYKAEHMMAIFGDSTSTQFATGAFSLEEVPLYGGIISKIWHPLVDKKVDDGELNLQSIKPGHLIGFNYESWHRGMPATKSGWRFFIRATRFTKREILNEQRHQVQIYISDSELNTGW